MFFFLFFANNKWNTHLPLPSNNDRSGNLSLNIGWRYDQNKGEIFRLI